MPLPQVFYITYYVGLVSQLVCNPNFMLYPNDRNATPTDYSLSHVLSN